MRSACARRSRRSPIAEEGMPSASPEHRPSTRSLLQRLHWPQAPAEGVVRGWMGVSWGRVVCGVLAAVAIAWLASAVDWLAARNAPAALGPRAPLIAIPYCFVVA